MKTATLIGQEGVKSHLVDTLKNGRIAHAQLFVGNQGSGGLPLALEYAKMIVSNFKDGKWQEKADSISLMKAEKMIHPDIHFSFPVNKTEKITKDKFICDDFIHLFREAVLKNQYLSLNDWYDFIGMGNKQGLLNVRESASISDKVKLKPYESDFKVFIIWMPEKMNAPAANKILKILEEPPGSTVFLMVTEDTDQLLPTILSRTQLIKLDVLSDAQLSDALVRNFNVESSQARSVAHLSSGNYRLAMKMISENEKGDFNRQEFIVWMRLCFTKDVISLLKWSEKTSKIRRENLKQLFEYALHMFRESLIMNYSDNSLLRLEGAEREFAIKFSPFINQANCMKMIGEFETAISHIHRNANAKILLFDLSIQVMKLIKVKPLEVE